MKKSFYALLGANIYAIGLIAVVQFNHVVIGSISGIIGLVIILFQTEEE